MRPVMISGRKKPHTPPAGVFRVKKPNGTVYWYYQARRGRPDQGPIIRMPDFGSPAFDREYDRLTKPAVRSTRDRKHEFSALVETYKAQPAWVARSQNTQITYGAALKHIIEAWGSRRVDGIKVSHVMSLINKFADRPSTGNMVRVQVKQLMKLAVQKGLRSDNPTREVDKLAEVGDSAKPLNPAAWAALISDEAPEALRRLAILGKATGQRISDLVQMRPCDRDQDGIMTTIMKLKGKPHWCPLKPDEAAVIDGWQQQNDTPYITKRNGRPYTEDSLRVVWNAYRATVEGQALATFTPHDLRATKVCDERISGKSHQQIAAMVGMSPGTVMKYSRHIDQRQAARGNTKGPDSHVGASRADQTVSLLIISRAVANELKRIQAVIREAPVSNEDATRLTPINTAIAALIQESHVLNL